MSDLPEFTQQKPSICEGFEYPCTNTNASWERMPTCFSDERSNWAYLCPQCLENAIEYWNERWDEYYSERL